MLKLNETPVRTARNFNINNIKLEDINVPENLEEFSNVSITLDSSKDETKFIKNNIDLTYGLGDFLTNQAKTQSNYNLKIDVNSKMNNNIDIEFNFDEENQNLVENILIEATENTKSNIVIKYASEENIEAYHNGIIKVIAKENSIVNIIFVNFLNTKSNNFVSIENEILDGAKVNTTIIDFGGKNSISNYYSNILGAEADNNLNTIYLGRENQLFDLNYICELRGEKSNVNFEVQGALKDSSKKHFKGTIDFKRGCKKAKGNENEACMLLSDKARSIALPMLLCSEEDVEGNHSTSSGKFGDKELFYIMSRGFDEKSAMKLLVRAKFNKILEAIKNDELKNEISYEIDRRLD
jgi:Fe-S cluster assembly scaffold protein SufB